MIGRQDNENLYLIYSTDLFSWDGGAPFSSQSFPGEFVQIGTCGAPIELDEGWLLLIHGVGPVRKCAIGAALLDLSDPSKVLGRSSEPLVRPEPSEREGYAQRRLYLWSDAPEIPDRRALRHVGHIFDRWDHRDRRASEDAP
jgi:predicted GH43/DUF377 family glycosyl hydrolase